MHVKRKNPPDAMDGHPSDFCDFGYRHLSAKEEQNLLKQQSESTSFPCPRYVDPVDAVLAALHPRNIGSDGTLILKEIEMLSVKFLEVVSFTQRSANRARIFRSSAGRQLNLQLGWIALKVKLGRNNLQWRCQTKPQCHDSVSIHRQLYHHLGGNRKQQSCSSQGTMA